MDVHVYLSCMLKWLGGGGGHVNVCFGTCGSQKTTSGIILRNAALLLLNVSHWSGVQQLVYPGWKANPKGLVLASPHLGSPQVWPPQPPLFCSLTLCLAPLKQHL